MNYPEFRLGTYFFSYFTEGKSLVNGVSVVQNMIENLSALNFNRLNLLLHNPSIWFVNIYITYIKGLTFDNNDCDIDVK